MDKTFTVVHAGIGRGWHVIEHGLLPGPWGSLTPDSRHASGPYTSKAQAEAKAAELRAAA